ncbi:MAG TPA: THUMP domain-containing protein [Burkholderiales bacterium]|nr:THUMP domain-containing protein [Burkholderiales bacterium]
MDWNVIVTVKTGPGQERDLLGALARFGRFRPTPFRGVCMGRVDDVEAFLAAILKAREAGKPWAERVARVIPVERVFLFAPETLTDQLRQAVAPFVARMSDGSFCVRLERRGLAGRLPSAEIERAVGEHVHELAAGQSKRMTTEFGDPDFVIAAETLGEECGVALLPRALRERYPFVQVR